MLVSWTSLATHCNILAFLGGGMGAPHHGQCVAGEILCQQFSRRHVSACFRPGLCRFENLSPLKSVHLRVKNHKSPSNTETVAHNSCARTNFQTTWPIKSEQTKARLWAVRCRRPWNDGRLVLRLIWLRFPIALHNLNKDCIFLNTKMPDYKKDSRRKRTAKGCML